MTIIEYPITMIAAAIAAIQPTPLTPAPVLDQKALAAPVVVKSDADLYKELELHYKACQASAKALQARRYIVDIHPTTGGFDPKQHAAACIPDSKIVAHKVDNLGM